MENYAEFLVKKRMSAGDIAKIALVAFALIFIVLSVSLWLGKASGFVVLIFGGYVAYLLITGIRREYEYIVTSDHLNVDEVIAQRHRRRICGFDFSAMELCASVHDPNKNGEMKRHFAKTINAASAPGAKNARFAVFSGEDGLCLLIFEPNDKILDSMRIYVKSKVF